MTTDTPDTTNSERLARAHLACQATIDDARGTMRDVIAQALAAGIVCLRDANGTIDPDEIREFLESSHANEISDVADELAAADAEDLAGAVLEAVEDICDIEDSLAAVIGVVEPLGGYDSTGFAMMTSGAMTTWAIRRGDHFLTFQTGDDCDYSLYDGGSLDDDPQLRRARLALAEELGGLGPGVWIERDEELSDELRDLTISGGWHWPDCWQDAMRHENIAELIEENLESFTNSTGLSEPDTRERLAELFEIGTPKDDVERDLLWDIWLSIRPT